MAIKYLLGVSTTAFVVVGLCMCEWELVIASPLPSPMRDSQKAGIWNDMS